MRKFTILSSLSLLASLGAGVSTLSAQNSILVFNPVNVRVSAAGSSPSNPATFNSATINLNCGTSPATAVLSSTPDGQGTILVDNNVTLTVIANGVPATPVDVCSGGTQDSSAGGPNCFTLDYGNRAAQLVGQNPDTFLSTTGGGVAPLNISSNLQAPLSGQPGALQVKIDLVDEGGYLASSSVYLNTSCTQASATGPAVITGNPIPSSNPTPQQLAQPANFDSTPAQQIQFTYDLTQAQNAGTLTITDGTIPQVSDNPLDPTTFQTALVHDTSFATSQCLIHTGESFNGNPACKLFTLVCSVGTGSTATGAQCPVSTLPNEIFADVFDGPGFTLPDINAPAGTFHQGIGFLMASEGWAGGPCQFDPTSGLGKVLCPQNLLTSFSGPGTYSLLGGTSHPNSTFVPIIQVPEDLTTITVAGQRPGGWINSSTANVTLSSQPPNLTGTTIPGAATFLASPIQSVTYGISPANSVPLPTAPATSPADTVLSNTQVGCPDPSYPASVPATVFTPAPQTLSGLADGQYLLHYFAQDCAGTQELKFTQDTKTQSWSTNYYTFPINVDTVAPAITSGPTLSPPAPTTGYLAGQPVYAAYSCTDDRSGLVQCGGSTYPQSANPTLSSGPLNTLIDTSTPGNKTYTVVAIDAAGNQSSVSVNYTVVPAYSAAIHVTLQPSTVTYPGGSNVVVQITPVAGHTATGSIKLLDGANVIQTANLQGNGAAYLYIHGLAVGTHPLSATYAGDAFNPAGNSAPVTLTVNPAPVTLTAACFNASFQFGANYYCGVYASSPAGAPLGAVTYSYDHAAPVSLTLQLGVATFSIPSPQSGAHSVTIAYAAQTNYAAAGPVTKTFNVIPASVIVSLTPSTWYLTGGSLSLTAAVQSPSAGPPNQLGSISFSANGAPLATVPVDASGTARTTVAPGTLPSGSALITATYSGSTNYAKGSTSIKVAVK